MHLKLLTGIAATGRTFVPGDVVDWKASDAECKRMIDRGLAVRASPHEVKAAEDKVLQYAPPPPRAEDRWPPGQLKPLKAHGED